MQPVGDASDEAVATFVVGIDVLVIVFDGELCMLWLIKFVELPLRVTDAQEVNVAGFVVGMEDSVMEGDIVTDTEPLIE